MEEEGGLLLLIPFSEGKEERAWWEQKTRDGEKEVETSSALIWVPES